MPHLFYPGVEALTTLKVLVQQPVCPPYRISFFAALATHCKLTVVAGRSASDSEPLLSISDPATWLQRRPHISMPFGGHLLRVGALKVADYDVVVVNFNPRHTASLQLYVAALHRGVPLLWWGQIWSYTSTKRNLAIRRWLMNRTSGVIAYTDREARIAHRIGVTPPTLSLRNSCLTRNELEARRATIATRERGSHFVMLGRLTDKSGFRTVLDLAPMFVDQARFTLVGASAEQMSSFGPAPLPNVTLVEGTNEESRKRAILADADYMIYPGAVGLTVVEALSMGLPVITHGDRRRHGPEHAYLRPGYNAEFTDGTFPQLVQAVANTVSGRITFAARRDIAESVRELSTDAMAVRMSAFLRRVVSR